MNRIVTFVLLIFSFNLSAESLDEKLHAIHQEVDFPGWTLLSLIVTVCCMNITRVLLICRSKSLLQMPLSSISLLSAKHLLPWRLLQRLKKVGIGRIFLTNVDSKNKKQAQQFKLIWDAVGEVYGKVSD